MTLPCAFCGRGIVDRAASLNAQVTYLQYGITCRYQSIVRGYCFGLTERVELLEVYLQQTQLTGPGHSFGAPLNLEFAKDSLIVPFNSYQGDEKPFANLTIRQSLGNES